MRRYRRLERFEAEQILWWHKVFFPPLCDLEFIYGTGWPKAADASLEKLVGRDALPTSFMKWGWLRHVIAIFARSGAWPGNMPVPGMSALEAVTGDIEIEQDQIDTRVGPAGSPDDVVHFHGQATKGGYTPLRWLTLAAWYLKPAAHSRILQFLKKYPPAVTRPPNWEWAVASSAIAATHFVHVKKDAEVRQALSHAAAAAHELKDDDKAAGLAAWLDRFLSYLAPYPERPPRR